MSMIWEKKGNLMLVESVMGPNQNYMENFGNLQPIARNMKPTLWILGENLSFDFLSKCSDCFFSSILVYCFPCGYFSGLSSSILRMSLEFVSIAWYVLIAAFTLQVAGQKIVTCLSMI